VPIIDDFRIVRQLKSLWCWAAVAQAIGRFYGITWATQERLALQRLGLSGLSIPGSHVTNFDKLNQPWGIEKGLRMIQCFRQKVTGPHSANTTEELMEKIWVAVDQFEFELGNRNPVVCGARLRSIYTGGGEIGHAIVVVGVEGVGQERVIHWRDPGRPDRQLVDTAYEFFVNLGGIGYIGDYYLTKPPSLYTNHPDYILRR
jgi:hypothetical protein